MMFKSKEQIENWIKEKGFMVYETIPDGWKRLKGALTAPRGYFWAHNCGNPFDGTSKYALIKEK